MASLDEKFPKAKSRHSSFTKDSGFMLGRHE